MKQTEKPRDSKVERPYHLRKLTKSGSARYLSVGKLLPKEWEVVKVYVITHDNDTITLQLERLL